MKVTTHVIMYIVLSVYFLAKWALQMMDSLFHDDSVKDRFFELQRFIPMNFELSFSQGKIYVQRRAHPRHYQDFYTFAP